MVAYILPASRAGVASIVTTPKITGTFMLAGVGAVREQVAGGGGSFVNWDPVTVSAVTLSGSNLVASNTGTTSTNQGAHVAFANGKTSGKYYFECTLTTFTGGAGVGVGIGTLTATYAGISTAATQGCMCFMVGHTGTGTIFLDPGGNTGYSLGARTTGDVIGIALDLGSRKVWFRVSPAGLWENTGGHDPTNSSSGGGFSVVGSGALVPFVTFGNGLAGQAGVVGNVITANFGASAFSGAVPVGYTAGLPPTVVAATSKASLRVMA
jgi:hypothetical protein